MVGSDLQIPSENAGLQKERLPMKTSVNPWLRILRFLNSVENVLETPLRVGKRSGNLALVERQQGFAEFYVYGQFVKFIDLR